MPTYLTRNTAAVAVVVVSAKRDVVSSNMKLTKEKLQQIIKEEYENVTTLDYYEDNPAAAGMSETIHELLEPHLKTLIPGYDVMNKKMERAVHDAVYAFAKELYNITKEVEAESDRYFTPKRK